MTSREKNMELAWAQFRSGSLRLESRPFRASIEITRNCNLKCVMCSQSWNPRYSRQRPEFDMSPGI
ncbi:MAG: hypothetical protein ABIG11_00300, partial [bacterium]